jgi:hypothetical protein
MVFLSTLGAQESISRNLFLQPVSWLAGTTTLLRSGGVYALYTVLLIYKLFRIKAVWMRGWEPVGNINFESLGPPTLPQRYIK